MDWKELDADKTELTYGWRCCGRSTHGEFEQAGYGAILVTVFVDGCVACA
jgi:hypothetical protein